MKFLTGNNIEGTDREHMGKIMFDGTGGDFDPDAMPMQVVVFDRAEFCQFLSHLGVSKEGCFEDEMLINQVMGEFRDLGRALDRT